MTKVILNDLVNLENQTSTVDITNANNAVIETAFDNTLSRDGTSPNQMQASLDMNSHQILNLPAPISGTEPVRLTDLNSFAGGPLIIDPLPAGGLTGQILQKNSNTNYDVSWTNGGKAVRGFVSVMDYGAKGDGIDTTAVTSIVSGTNQLSLVGTSFTSNDIGKTILVQGAGAVGSDLTTTISSVINATNVVLGSLAGTTRSAVSSRIVYGTDNSIVLAAAQTAALAGSFGLYWPAGKYVTTTVLDLTASNSWHSNSGGTSILFVGSGIAVKFDGNGSFLFNTTFGSREFPFIIKGNSKCTTALYCNYLDHSNVNVICRECSSTAVTCTNAVLGNLFVECSTNTGAMITKPIIGLSTNGVNYCNFEANIEGLIAGNGIEALDSNYCSYTGTSEGNSGGVYEGPGSNANIFYNFDCESNTGLDWFLDQSTYTTLAYCVGSTTLRMDGVGLPRILYGSYNAITIDAASTYPYLEGVVYGTLTNNSTTTIYQRLWNGSTMLDHLKRPLITAPTFLNSWFNYGVGFRAAGYWQEPNGMVHLTGCIANSSGLGGLSMFTIPTGFRPSAALVFNYPNAVDSTQGQIQITAAGSVNHGAGTTTFVSLDGISFMAEQ